MEVIDKSSMSFIEDSADAKQNTVVQEILKDSVTVRQRLNSSESNGISFLGGISSITDSLLLTSAALINDYVLEKFDVTCVINTAAELPDSPVDKEMIDYYKIPVLDSSDVDLSFYFDQVADIIQNVTLDGGRTLIHCVAGVSRSASLCIAFLMKHHGFTLLESYNHVKTCRPTIKPNVGFFKQLIDYEMKLFQLNTINMIYNDYLNLFIPDVYDSQYRFYNNYRKKNIDDNSRR